MQGHEVQGRQLRRERFCRGDANFRTGPRVENGVGNSSRHGSDDVRYREALALVSKLSLRGDRVQRLAGLSNKDEEGVREYHRISIPILTRIINFDGNASHRFDHVFSSRRSMPARTASKDTNVLEALPNIIAECNVFQMNPITLERESSKDRVLDRDGLLINFFEHEVFVPAFFSHDRIPGDVLELRLPTLTRVIEQTNAVACDDCDFMIVEEEDRSCVGKHRRNVGRNKAFAIDGANDQRIPFPHSNDLLRIIRTHARESEQPFQLRQGFKHGVLEISLGVLFDEMGNDFGISLGCELVALFDELSVQRKIVLDDAIVGHHDTSLAIPMRVRILLGRTSVRRPTRVSQTELAIDWLLGKELFEIFQLAGRASDLKLSIFNNCDARRIVPPIFERPKTAHDDGHRVLRTNVSENAAHFATGYQRVRPRITLAFRVSLPNTLFASKKNVPSQRLRADRERGAEMRRD